LSLSKLSGSKLPLNFNALEKFCHESGDSIGSDRAKAESQ
jgi:hypothetical protein